MAGGAIGIKLSPLWYVIDSCPMIRAPPNGSGTEKKKNLKYPPKKPRNNFTIFHSDFLFTSNKHACFCFHIILFPWTFLKFFVSKRNLICFDMATMLILFEGTKIAYTKKSSKYNSLNLPNWCWVKIFKEKENSTSYDELTCLVNKDEGWCGAAMKKLYINNSQLFQSTNHFKPHDEQF